MAWCVTTGDLVDHWAGCRPGLVARLDGRKVSKIVEYAKKLQSGEGEEREGVGDVLTKVGKRMAGYYYRVAIARDCKGKQEVEVCCSWPAPKRAAGWICMPASPLACLNAALACPGHQGPRAWRWPASQPGRRTRGSAPGSSPAVDYFRPPTGPRAAEANGESSAAGVAWTLGRTPSSGEHARGRGGQDARQRKEARPATSQTRRLTGLSASDLGAAAAIYRHVEMPRAKMCNGDGWVWLRGWHTTFPTRSSADWACFRSSCRPRPPRVPAGLGSVRRLGAASSRVCRRREQSPMQRVAVTSACSRG